MKYVTIGTAGHVDHGKTALIKALTGVDTDRLKEEKERGISIELGFAYLDLPGGVRAGIVDVPGHERFIKNMVAGVGGIDIVLLVVAADEGVMPQTREHLDIIRILGINRGVVALSKVDLVDAEWLELVTEEVRDYVNGTALAGAPVIPVSAVTGEGLKELIVAISALVRSTQERVSDGPVRLPIDRVFTISGFGTVVTGTLISGTVKEGDTLDVLPQKAAARARSIQVHNTRTQTARAGQRVAVNLAGLDRQAVVRGNVLASPDVFTPSVLVDARVFLLPKVKAVKNRSRVRFHMGTAEVTGRVVLLERDELAPGESCYAQFILEEPVVAGRHERFVLRSISPVTTIGGGTVLEPAAKRKKRFRKDVIEYLDTLETGTPAEKVLTYLGTAGTTVETGRLAEATGLEQDVVAAVADELAGEGSIKLVTVDSQIYLFHAERYSDLARRIQELIRAYHREFPLREGYAKEELRSRVFPDVNNRVFQALLQVMADDGMIGILPQAVTAADFTGKPSGAATAVLKRIEEVYRGKLQPPNWDDAASQAGLMPEEAGEYASYLLRTGTLVKVSEDLFYHNEALREIQAKLVTALQSKGEISLGEVRDLFNTSRKYALPILEYFDLKRVTKRLGDKRVLLKRQDVR
ncbi:MAG: selenocysteine-specific translation elongation factor [Bacillota bacterium]